MRLSRAAHIIEVVLDLAACAASVEQYIEHANPRNEQLRPERAHASTLEVGLLESKRAANIMRDCVLGPPRVPPPAALAHLVCIALACSMDRYCSS